MEQLLQSLLAAPEWVQVFVLWAVLSAPLNLFGMVLLYRMGKHQGLGKGHGIDEGRLREIAHAQALIALAEYEERRRCEDADGGLERVLK